MQAPVSNPPPPPLHIAPDAASTAAPAEPMKRSTLWRRSLGHGARRQKQRQQAAMHSAQEAVQAAAHNDDAVPAASSETADTNSAQSDLHFQYPHVATTNGAAAAATEAAGRGSKSKSPTRRSFRNLLRRGNKATNKSPAASTSASAPASPCADPGSWPSTPSHSPTLSSSRHDGLADDEEAVQELASLAVSAEDNASDTDYLAPASPSLSVSSAMSTAPPAAVLLANGAGASGEASTAARPPMVSVASSRALVTLPAAEDGWELFIDDLGRPFAYHRQYNQARLVSDMVQWPRLFGPPELSSRTASSSNGARRLLSLKYRELDAQGLVRRHEYLPGILPGCIDRQLSKNTGLILQQELRLALKAHVHTTEVQQVVALKTLTLLEHFLPVIPNYKYEMHKPSHVWTDTESSPNMSYLQEFLLLLPALCEAATDVLGRDPTLVELRSPAYVLGDLHGNYRDLQYFASQFWRTGVDLCPSDLLFLGDYVDRGPHSVELMAYLLSLKILYPHKIFLLRGNHELESVCGNVEYYGRGSFKAQLAELVTQADVAETFEDTWDMFMRTFEWLPLAATIDGNIFCCHAGLPRAVMMHDTSKPNKWVLDAIRAMERPLSEDGDIDGNPDCIAMDLLWADPASEEDKDYMGQHGLPRGFAPNMDRGGDSCVFGEEAVQTFSATTACDYILRAHQPPDKGIRYQAGAKVITVFSSSHYCGMNNSAALIVVQRAQIDIVTTGETTAADREPSATNVRVPSRSNTTPESLKATAMEAKSVQSLPSENAGGRASTAPGVSSPLRTHSPAGSGRRGSTNQETLL